jgi:Histidine kinase
VVLLFAMVALVYVVNGVGAVLSKIAARLLGLSAAERIEQLERRTDRLVERNRLARELHDSVGHALSVVTIQAGAGRRTLRTDPDFTEQALLAIEESARSALDELDHVLGDRRAEHRAARGVAGGLPHPAGVPDQRAEASGEGAGVAPGRSGRPAAGAGGEQRARRGRPARPAGPAAAAGCAGWRSASRSCVVNCPWDATKIGGRFW